MSDTYKYSQLAYKGNENLWGFILAINKEAFKSFISSVTIGKTHEIRREVIGLNNQIENKYLYLFNNMPFKNAQMNNGFWESVFIGTGFELAFKSLLIEKGIIIHKFQKNSVYYKQQKKRPVLFEEYIKEPNMGFYFNEDEKCNLLRDLTIQTLDFSLIVNNDLYSEVLGVDKFIIELANDYRIQRNEIHLPGEFSERKLINRIDVDIVNLIISFINDKLVKRSNGFCKIMNFSNHTLPQLELGININ